MIKEPSTKLETLKLEVIVEDEIIIATLDTGAKANYVNAEWALQKGLEISKLALPHSIEIANGRVTQIQESTTLTLQIKGQEELSMRLKAFVLPGLPTTLNVELETLRDQDMKLDLAQELIELKGKSFRLFNSRLKDWAENPDKILVEKILLVRENSPSK